MPALWYKEIDMKLLILTIIVLLLLPGCSLWWWSDMSYYDINFYGRLVDEDKSFHPNLSREDRIYLKYIQMDPKRHANNIPTSNILVTHNTKLD